MTLPEISTGGYADSLGTISSERLLKPAHGDEEHRASENETQSGPTGYHGSTSRDGQYEEAPKIKKIPTNSKRLAPKTNPIPQDRQEDQARRGEYVIKV